jgi:hypothetical protein
VYPFYAEPASGRFSQLAHASGIAQSGDDDLLDHLLGEAGRGEAKIEGITHLIYAFPNKNYPIFAASWVYLENFS